MDAARTKLALVCVAVLLSEACGTKVGKTLSGLALVRSEIVKKFGENQVNVRENTFNNSSSVIVTFINSSLNDKTDDLRVARAQATAEIVKALYPSIAQVDEIWVLFVRQTTRFLVVTYTEGISSFGFDRNAQWLDHDTSEPVTSSLTARANYLESKNETEISLELLLEGNAFQGLSTFPHFTLKGDATKHQSPPPDVVTFDFASYSSTRRFQPDVPLRINVDNETIYEKEVTFSASKAAAGQVAEFLYLPVPYDEFRQIGNGTDVTISIGDQKFTLKREQVIALKNMNAYVKAAARRR